MCRLATHFGLPGLPVRLVLYIRSAPHARELVPEIKLDDSLRDSVPLSIDNQIFVVESRVVFIRHDNYVSVVRHASRLDVDSFEACSNRSTATLPVSTIG